MEINLNAERDSNPTVVGAPLSILLPASRLLGVDTLRSDLMASAARRSLV